MAISNEDRIGLYNAGFTRDEIEVLNTARTPNDNRQQLPDFNSH